MKPERRDTPRIAVTLEVMYNPDNTGFKRGVARNVSLDGVYLDVGQHAVPKRSAVDLAIKLDSAGGTKIYRFHAMAVHANAQGVGLMFDRVSTDGYSALFDLVYAREPRFKR